MIKKRLIGLLSHAKKYVLFNILWQWMALLAQIAAVFAIAGMFEAMFYRSVNKNLLLRTATILLVVIAVRVVSEKMVSKFSYLAGADVKRILRDKIYEKLLRLGPSYKENVSTAEVVQLCTEGVEQLEIYFGRYLSQLFYALLAPITLFLILSISVSMKAALVLLACVPLIPLSIVAVMKIAKKLLNKYWGLYAELGDSFLENLQGLTTAKIYKADSLKAKQMDEEASHFRRITMKVLTMQLNSTSVMDIMAYGGAAVGIIVSLGEFSQGKIGISGMIAVILLAAEFFLPLRILGSYFHIAMNGMAASNKIFKLLDMDEEKKGNGLIRESAGGGGIPVHMSNVSFSYEAERDVLKSVDMIIPAGKLTALVGASGCGKSTIAGILTGKNKHYHGNIKIGDMEFRDISEEALLSSVVLVRSGSYLFKGTVEENLRLAAPDATEEEMWSVLSRVNLCEFLKSKEGLQTKLSERGSNLSGGQAQRLALARAMLTNASILILDEATSNIDAESEDMIMQVVHELAKTKTVILISHRLYNVTRADCIYMLQDGRCVESGMHEKLLEANGEYAKLFESQRSLEEFAAKPILDAKVIQKTVKKQEQEIEKNKDIEEKEEKGKRRSGMLIMSRLIVLVAPLLHVMLSAILLGVIGHLCAIFLTVSASRALVESIVQNGMISEEFPVMLWFLHSPFASFGIFLIILAVARGVFHYAEQYCNHFIAFKLLAIIRQKVFAALRRLCPAKLEGKDRGNLISIITTDIELLEVFYAHTISPIAIAFLVSLMMIGILFSMHPYFGLIAFFAYLTVGIVIPLINSLGTRDDGMVFREKLGDLSSFVLEALRGLEEIMQYLGGEKKRKDLLNRQKSLAGSQEKLSRREGMQSMLTTCSILVFSYAMLFVGNQLYSQGGITFDQVLFSAILMMGSFGPVIALSRLSNNLHQTLASGERVLRILEEAPVVEEVEGKEEKQSFQGAKLSSVSFAYPKGQKVLEDYDLELEENRIYGIHGPSGCGKSTILKLLMRFWDANSGKIDLSGRDIRHIPTDMLRDLEAYVTQETYLFHDSIAKNIAIGKENASMEEITRAAKSASIHDFIVSLPKGYDTEVGELGDTLSGGEKQRIGIARAFLHDAPFVLLDEPTSNLDSLNEKIILKALKETADKKTVVIVSHRASTMHVVDTIVEMGA